MSRTSRLLSGLLALGAAALPSDASPADSPILESRGPSSRHFPVGSRLPDDAVILLRPGDRLVIHRSVGPVTYYGPAYFRLSDEPVLVERRRVGVPAGSNPIAPPRRRWLPPPLRRNGSESIAEQSVREGFIICPGNPRCPG